MAEEQPELTAVLCVTLLLALLVLALRPRRPPKPTQQQLVAMLQRVQLLKALGEPEIVAAVQALEERTYRKGEVICKQDVPGEDCFFVVSGECVGTTMKHELDVGTRVRHDKRGEGTVTKVTYKPNITRVDFDSGEYHRYTPPSLHKLKPVEAVEPKTVEVLRCGPGDHFGERVLERLSRVGEKRPFTVTCRTRSTVLRLTAATFLKLKEQQDYKENLLRSVPLFETFGDDQIAKLASLMRLQAIPDGMALIKQGEEGKAFYILEAGHCIATIKIGSVTKELKRYSRGELFGDKALLEHTRRATSVTAVGAGVRVWTVSNEMFEQRLGALSVLRAEQYRTDPRHLIADFYQRGDASGPSGSCKVVPKANGNGGAAPPSGTAAVPAGGPSSSSSSSLPSSSSSSSGEASTWFAVYRPCSSDSIRKMVNRVGTGKGLNIKGKSAKKNRLSGFVPFCQISDNAHKTALESTPADARMRIFYQSAAACAEVREALQSVLMELQVEKGKKLQIEKQEVCTVSEYEPDVYGLDAPELLVMELYIMRPNLAPLVGWETGRGSEPAFLDMNRHAVRDGGKPPVVLYQFDRENPFNSAGLLMAYAEKRVKPVVSDFDTFLVGSRGVRYESTPEDQISLMNWALDHTESFLNHPNDKGWMSRWLEVLKDEAEKGFHPHLPEYGFGDPTSYGLIGDVVQQTSSCGAVRHGAECFNFYFPQELDDQFLVVWDGLKSPRPWTSMKEPELRAFLVARAREGFSFPLNPVWPVRDRGWLEVLQALQQHGGEVSRNLDSWFPPASGVMARITQLHEAHPKGFRLANAATPDEKLSRENRNRRNPSFWENLSDCDMSDLANYASLEVRYVTKARWRRVRSATKMSLLGLVPEVAHAAG